MAERGGGGDGGEDAEGRETGVGERRKSEEEVYMMLFQEVDVEKRGKVAVNSLVEFLLRMQLGSSQGQEEEVYDSHEDVYLVRYNIQLLKAMLEENSDSAGQVDLATYTRVIRCWVKDIRDRSNQQRSLEVSQMSSDSEDEEVVSMTMPLSQHQYTGGDQSFETCGGNSSTRSGNDSIDLLASMEDLRQENRRLQERLQERERELQRDLDQTEEQLRTTQNDNTSLLSRINRMQQEHTNKLEKVEGENTIISASLGELEGRYQSVQENAEKWRQELQETQNEVHQLREALEEGEGERQKELHETAQLQQKLGDKEVALEEEKERCQRLQAQLLQLITTHNSLKLKLAELEEGNAVLQRENEELQNASIPSGPAYSTPYRPGGPPSLHDEISHHGNFSSGIFPSPLVGVDRSNHRGNEERGGEGSLVEQSDPSLSCSQGNLTLDDLEQIARSSSNKFHTKADVIVRLLSELMPLSTSSSSPKKVAPSVSSDSITELSTRTTKQQQQSTSNLRQLVSCIKRLYKDKKQLKAQVEELQEKLRNCRRGEEVEEVDAGIQTDPTPSPSPPLPPSPPVALPTQHQTPPIPTPRPGLVKRCTGLVAGVTRLIIWLLYLALLLLLICAVFVWLHQHSSPCCRGNRRLTPGGMVWSLFEGHVTVSRSGYI